MEANLLGYSNFKVLKNMIPSESNGQIISYSTKQEKDTFVNFGYGQFLKCLSKSGEEVLFSEQPDFDSLTSES